MGLLLLGKRCSVLLCFIVPWGLGFRVPGLLWKVLDPCGFPEEAVALLGSCEA